VIKLKANGELPDQVTFLNPPKDHAESVEEIRFLPLVRPGTPDSTTYNRLQPGRNSSQRDSLEKYPMYF
jgi:hypothetical protein